MSHLYAEDPAITLLDSTIRDVLRDGFLNTASYEPETLEKHILQIQLYRGGYLKTRALHRLSAAFDSFSHFAVSFEACLDAVERTVPKIINSGGFGPIPEYLQMQKDAFEKLELLFTNLTPAHFALQEHFYTLYARFIFSDDEDTQSNIDHFFHPLQNLRDNYFKTPRSSIIQAYLAKSCAFLESDFYRNKVAANMPANEIMGLMAEISKYEVELEVWALMDTAA